MRTHTFKGGIFPPERKELSCECQIENAFPSSKTVTIPVTMGGAPNTPFVKVGDEVLKGQVIAGGDKFMSVPVHSSVSGRVKKIENRLVTANAEVPCIIIESDEQEKTSYMPQLDPFSCTKEEAISRIRDAGIVGMGGASFPTHVKMNPPPGKKIEFVLLNAAECEPYLTIDERTMKEDSEKVIDGLSIEMKITGGAGIIALEENKKFLEPILNSAISKNPNAKEIKICIVKTKYPQGAEKNITKAVLNREIPSGGLPADAGCLISNVGTACAISDAFRLGKPLIERGLTISGGACETPKNLRVPIGTLVGDLIPQVVSLKSGKTCKIISGGPMMGFAMTNANFPIAKGTSGILFLTKEETYIEDESPCINCGKCLKACPMHLTPVMIVRSIKSGDYEAAKKFGLMDCFECGSCAFVCPANVRLVQRFRMGKAVLRTKMMEEKARLAASAQNNQNQQKSAEGGK